MLPRQQQRDPRNARDWRLRAVVITTVLFPVALIAIVLTAPISEMHVSVWNVDEADTVHIQLYLDGSRAAGLYAGPGGAAVWVFHVPPGTHSIGVDFTYNYSYGSSHDGDVEYLWTARAEFNSILHRSLCVDSEGINTDHRLNLIAYLSPQPPLIQAVNDRHFMLPIATLSALHVLLVVAIWNYQRTPPKG